MNTLKLDLVLKKIFHMFLNFQNSSGHLLLNVFLARHLDRLTMDYGKFVHALIG